MSDRSKSRNSRHNRIPRGGRRGGRGKRPSILKKAVLIATAVGVPLAAVAGGMVYGANELGKEKPHEVTYCYERDDQQTVAMFLDASHSHAGSDSQRRDLKNVANRSWRSLEQNGSFSVFGTLNQDVATINEPLFTFCKPPKNQKEQAEISAPEKNDAYLRRLHDEAIDAFDAKLSELIRDAQDPDKAAKNSPILEQIQAITRYDFAAPLTKLVMFTDGMNNSLAGKFCQKQNEMPRFEVFSQRPAYQYIKPEDLSGIDVEIYLVEFGKLPSDALPYCTTEELRQFWVDYFTANGAKSVRLTPLGLGAG